MSPIRLLAEDWRHQLGGLVRGARDSLLISSPYVTVEGVRFVAENLSDRFRAAGAIRVLTDLSPLSISRGSTDPMALRALAEAAHSFALAHLPRLHAKVCLADSNVGIVTSANLTAGGLLHNHEYGVEIGDPARVGRLRRDMDAYAQLGASVSADKLAAYCEVADGARTAFRQLEARMSKAIRRTFEQALRTSEDHLIRLRLEGGPVHRVFGKTILYLLARHGPLRTVDLHSFISAIHPDLCDERIDRVIDGKRFGKKWKHAVRTAQQALKRRGAIRLDGDRWTLTAPPA